MPMVKIKTATIGNDHIFCFIFTLIYPRTLRNISPSVECNIRHEKYIANYLDEFLDYQT